MYHKPTNTMRSILVHPKAKTPKGRQCGTIYPIAATMTPIIVSHIHVEESTNTKVLDRELDWHRRKVNEAIHIRQCRPTMNRDQDYQLPPIYGKIIPPIAESFHLQNFSMWSAHVSKSTCFFTQRHASFVWPDDISDFSTAGNIESFIGLTHVKVNII